MTSANGSVYNMHWEHGARISMIRMEGRGSGQVFVVQEGAYEIFVAYILI